MPQNQKKIRIKSNFFTESSQPPKPKINPPKVRWSDKRPNTNTQKLNIYKHTKTKHSTHYNTKQFDHIHPQTMAVSKLALAATSGKSCKILLGLRLLAFSATLSAAIVMGLNKETKTFVVGKVGNTPIQATFTAKFDHTPAFV